MTYNFSSLSYIDFEELTCDLLQAEWNIRLEIFTTGRDGGIDLRHIANDGKTVIVQCKHMPNARFSSIQSEAKKEALKVRNLSPTRYVFITSAGLTPENKADLKDVFHPYIQSEEDIKGANDLSNLLRQHSDVEKRFFKLWLTSTATLERVLHNAAYAQLEAEINRITSRIALFVQNDAFPHAQEILNEQNVIIISGIPGIGKTTLADLLFYASIEQGYEPVIIYDIQEALDLFTSSRKQIFYFDDFLGQTFLEDRWNISNNKDNRLIRFIAQIQSTKQRFILTTREHILRSAMSSSSIFSESNILDHRYILALQDYSNVQRARILYNHIYFSNLPSEYKNAIINESFYLLIVKHRNFSPRIIEWLSDYRRISKENVDPSQYAKYIENLLDDPNTIWKNSFHQQLTIAAQDILFVLETFHGKVFIPHLKSSWEELHTFKSKKYNFKFQNNDFIYGLESLEGNFIRIIPEQELITFVNPSLRDFVKSIILSNTSIFMELINSCQKFSQLDYLKQISSGKFFSIPDVLPRANLILEKEEKLYNSIINIILMIKWAEEENSEPLMSIILDKYAHIISHPDVQHMPINIILNLIETSSTTSWIQSKYVLNHAELLKTVLENMKGAFSDDWVKLANFREDYGYWQPEHDNLWDEAIECYKSDMFDAEIEGNNDNDDIEATYLNLSKLDDLFPDEFTTINELYAQIDDQDYYDRDDLDLDSRSSARNDDDDDSIHDMFTSLL